VPETHTRNAESPQPKEGGSAALRGGGRASSFRIRILTARQDSEALKLRLHVEATDSGRLLRLVIDAGRGNVIDRALIGELREVVAGPCLDPSVCAIVIDHAGPDFSFGASVEEHAPGEVRTMLPGFHAFARELLGLDVPLLAAVRGRCLGAGLELAALADRVCASPSSTFAQPEIKLGVFAPIGSALLPRLVGARNASDLLLSGRTLEAAEAQRMGLVAELVEDPTQAALDWAREHLLCKSAEALRHATRAARCAWVGRFVEDLARLEGAYLGELMRTHDACEGIAAFLAKRKPVWKDR